MKAVTRAARDAAITEALKHTDTTDVWIIHSSPGQRALDRYANHGAEIHTIDPGRETVMHRIKHERPKHLHAAAAAWYDQQDTHTPKPTKATKPKSTTARGYGHAHQINRRRLLANLRDGTPCDWCGQPMYRDAKRNPDSAPLEADHTKALKHHNNNPADRLLHRRCNRQRHDGKDERRPLNNPTPETPAPKPPKRDTKGTGHPGGTNLGWEWLS